MAEQGNSHLATQTGKSVSSHDEIVGLPKVAIVLGPTTGGVGQHVRSLTRWLVRFGHEVTVVGPKASEELFRFTETGVRFIPAEISANPHPLRLLSLIKTVREALKGAQVVHAHNLTAGFITALARRSIRPMPPFVVTWHNLLLDQGIKRVVFEQVERFLAHTSDIALGVSTDLVARAQLFGATKAQLAPVAAPLLGKPMRSRAEIRAELGLEGKAASRSLVLAAGRLHPQKSFDVLIAAAARWMHRPQPPLLAIAGNGPQRAQLVALAERLRAPVVFLGRRTDIADLLAACDIAVVSSQWEARQLFAQEVLQAGKPLVATGVGGIPELVGDVAILVPPGNVDALDTAITSLLDNPKLIAQLADKSKLQAATLPSEEQVAAQISNVYVQLIGSRPSS